MNVVVVCAETVLTWASIASSSGSSSSNKMSLLSKSLGTRLGLAQRHTHCMRTYIFIQYARNT